jgi:hypothetical protein
LNHYNLSVPDAVTVIAIPDEPRDLYQLKEADLAAIRDSLLRPFGFRVSGPTQVALYLFNNNWLVVENFRNEEAHFILNFDKPFEEKEKKEIAGSVSTLPKPDSVDVDIRNNSITFRLMPRSLAGVKLDEKRF